MERFITSRWPCLWPVRLSHPLGRIRDMSVTELGKRLVDRRQAITAMEAEWFEWLVEFDNHCDWTLDGHANCVSWLVDHCGMARPTAKDKLRVAHQLARRASIGDAYRNGELSYSKVRAITRIDDADFDTDQRMLELASVGDTADVERAVRHWQLIKAQDQPPDAIWERRALPRTSKREANTTNQLVLPDDVDQRLMQILDAAAAVDKVSAESADPMAPAPEPKPEPTPWCSWSKPDSPTSPR